MSWRRALAVACLMYGLLRPQAQWLNTGLNYPCRGVRGRCPLLLITYSHLLHSVAYSELRAHFLDLCGLLFHRCRETLNRTFQFRDSGLRFEKVVEHNLGRRDSDLVSVSVDGYGAYFSSGIGVHKLGGGHVKASIEDT